MTALASSGRLGFLEVLAAELAPREGRWAAAARIAVAAALTVAIAMVFRIPEPAYMAYVVFLISRDDRSASVTSALGGLLAATLAIAVTLTLALFDMGEPALRIPAMAIATFLAMYSTRTFALGQLTFLAGFVVVLLQSLIDEVPNAEVFTRATLWVWVVVAVPVAITVAMQAVFGHDLEVTIRRNVRKVLREMKGAVSSGDFRRQLPQWRGILVPMLNAQRDGAAGHISDGTLVRLLEILTILEVVPASLPAATREVWSAQVDACLRLLDGRPQGAGDTQAGGEPDASITSPAVKAFGDGLVSLQEAIAQGGGPVTPHERGKRSLFVADAFTNPGHWQFALKTTAAVMTSYAIYTLLDWPGIRTAMVTCFFVALASFGETLHKLVLRLCGALIGGLIAGLCIVFVLPNLTDIGQLCALIAFVSLGAAWIATSSELLAYMGLQIGFAFFLGVLQGYAPATDLTVLRDRIAGILLGNIVITIVFSTLWPESAKTSFRNALSAVLRSLGAILKDNAVLARGAAAQALSNAQRLQTLGVLELRMLATAGPSGGTTPALSSVERLAGATFVTTAQPFAAAGNREALTRLGEWMDVAADHMLRGQQLPDVPDPELGNENNGPVRGAKLALQQLREEIAHVAAAKQ